MDVGPGVWLLYVLEGNNIIHNSYGNMIDLSVLVNQPDPNTLLTFLNLRRLYIKTILD